jgi:hypothetical protein
MSCSDNGAEGRMTLTAETQYFAADATFLGVKGYDDKISIEYIFGEAVWRGVGTNQPSARQYRTGGKASRSRRY